jgi:hypothetical protein
MKSVVKFEIPVDGIDKLDCVDSVCALLADYMVSSQSRVHRQSEIKAWLIQNASWTVAERE